MFFKYWKNLSPKKSLFHLQYRVGVERERGVLAVCVDSIHWMSMASCHQVTKSPCMHYRSILCYSERCAADSGFENSSTQTRNGNIVMILTLCRYGYETKCHIGNIRMTKVLINVAFCSTLVSSSAANIQIFSIIYALSTDVVNRTVQFGKQQNNRILFMLMFAQSFADVLRMFNSVWWHFQNYSIDCFVSIQMSCGSVRTTGTYAYCHRFLWSQSFYQRIDFSLHCMHKCISLGSHSKSDDQIRVWQISSVTLTIQINWIETWNQLKHWMMFLTSGFWPRFHLIIFIIIYYYMDRIIIIICMSFVWHESSFFLPHLFAFVVTEHRLPLNNTIYRFPTIAINIYNANANKCFTSALVCKDAAFAFMKSKAINASASVRRIRCVADRKH